MKVRLSSIGLATSRQCYYVLIHTPEYSSTDKTPRVLAFLSGVTIFTFWTSDNSLSPCGHIEPNPAHGRWRLDST